MRQGPQVLAAAPGAAATLGGGEAGEAGLAGVGPSCPLAATISAFDRRLFRSFPLVPPAGGGAALSFWPRGSASAGTSALRARSWGGPPRHPLR